MTPAPAPQERGAERAAGSRPLSVEHRMAIGATQLSTTLDDYRQHTEAGERRCYACKTWHPRSEMATRRSKPEGLDNICKQANRERALVNMRRFRAREREART